ncbi:MAG: hypothetical protein WC294_09045 [Methanoregula sp.]|jgi:hypothetical protein
MSKPIVVKDKDMLFSRSMEIVNEIYTTTIYCPHCEGPINLPLMVSESDRKKFDAVIDSILIWAKESGVQDFVLSKVLEAIHDSMRKKIKLVEGKNKAADNL